MFDDLKSREKDLELRERLVRAKELEAMARAKEVEIKCSSLLNLTLLGICCFWHFTGD